MGNESAKEVTELEKVKTLPRELLDKIKTTGKKKLPKPMRPSVYSKLSDIVNSSPIKQAKTRNS
jgi:hypothetical protein